MLLFKQLHTSLLAISPRLLFPNCYVLLLNKANSSKS